MMQSRTHTCGELRLADVGKTVTLAGFLENVRVVGSNFAFVVLRDFYGTTQLVVETEKLQQTAQLRRDNPEATLSELAEMPDPPVSKSAMNHRMRKLIELSKEH